MSEQKECSDITVRQGTRIIGVEFLAACLVMSILGTLAWTAVRANAEDNLKQDNAIEEVTDAVGEIKNDVSRLATSVSVLATEVAHAKQDRMEMQDFMKEVRQTMKDVNDKLYQQNRGGQ